MMMETVKVAVAVSAVVLSIVSLFIAQLADKRAKKAEAVRNLLGERESVAFGALKLMRDGLPPNPRDRKLVIAALMQACLFESSDRARALLYRVIETNRAGHEDEFREAFETVQNTFEAMSRYGFSKEELDLERGKRRMEVVRKVLTRDTERAAR
jgi:hypothetical protein